MKKNKVFQTASVFYVHCGKGRGYICVEEKPENANIQVLNWSRKTGAYHPFFSICISIPTKALITSERTDTRP